MVKSVKEFFKRILIITMIMITLIFFVIDPYAEAAQLPAEGEFYYAGTQTGVYVVTENIFAWLANVLGDVIDWILGFITMAFRMSFVGWATIFEWLLTRTLEASTGLDYFNDALSATNMTSTNDSSQNVTVESIVYNNVPLFNVNFFDFEIDPNRTGTGRDLTQLKCDKCKKTYDECTCVFKTDCSCTCCRTKNAMNNMIANASDTNVVIIIKETIAQWFNVMRVIALAGMLCVLLLIGIKIAISSLASEKAVYKRMLVDWLAGMAFLFLVPYIMLFIINLNEMLVDIIENYAKSPESIATKITKVEFGADEKTNEDLEIGVYEAVRSRAYDIKLINGITGMVMYITLVVFAWRFSWMYLKRYFTLIVLTLMAPGVAFSYALQKVFTGKAKSWSNWLHEYIVNVLIQTVHAILYASFVSIALAVSLNSIAGMIIAFILMNFMLKADKIFRKIFKMSEGGSLLDRVSQGAEEAKLDKLVKGAQNAVLAAGPAMKIARKSPAAALIRNTTQLAGAGVVGFMANRRRINSETASEEVDKEYEGAHSALKGAETLQKQGDAHMAKAEEARARLAELEKKKVTGKEKNKKNKEMNNLRSEIATQEKAAARDYSRAEAEAEAAMNKIPQADKIRAMLPDEKAAHAQELAKKEQMALYKAMLAKEEGKSDKETTQLFDEYRQAKKERKKFDRYAKNTTMRSAADKLFDYDRYYDENGNRRVSYEYNPETGLVERKGMRSRIGSIMNGQDLFGISKEEEKLAKEALLASASGFIGLGSMFLGLATVVSSPGLGMGLLAYGTGKTATSFRPNRNIGTPKHRSKYANKNYYGMEFASQTVRNMNKIILEEVEAEIIQLQGVNGSKKLKGNSARRLAELKKQQQSLKQQIENPSEASKNVMFVIDQMYGGDKGFDGRGLAIRGATTITDSFMGGFAEKLDELEAKQNENFLKQVAEYQKDALLVQAKAEEIDTYRILSQLDKISAEEDQSSDAYFVSKDGNTRFVIADKPMSPESVELFKQVLSEVKTDPNAELTDADKKKALEKIKELSVEKKLGLFTDTESATKKIDAELAKLTDVDEKTKEAYKEDRKRRKAKPQDVAVSIVGNDINEFIKQAMREMGIEGGAGSLSQSMKNKLKQRVKEIAKAKGKDLKDYYNEEISKDGYEDRLSKVVDDSTIKSLDDAMERAIEQNVFAEVERKISMQIDMQIESEVLSKLDGAVDRMFADNQIKEKRKDLDLKDPETVEKYELTENERYEVGEKVKAFIKKNKYDSIKKVTDNISTLAEEYASQSKGEVSLEEAAVRIKVFMKDLQPEKTLKGRVQEGMQTNLKNGMIKDAAMTDSVSERRNIIQAMRSAVPPPKKGEPTPEKVAEQNRIVGALLEQMTTSYRSNQDVITAYGKKSDSPVDYKQYVKIQGPASYQTAKTAKKTGRDVKKLTMGEDPTVYGPLVGLDKIVKNM